jgi:hypothetical protein
MNKLNLGKTLQGIQQWAHMRNVDVAINHKYDIAKRNERLQEAAYRLKERYEPMFQRLAKELHQDKFELVPETKLVRPDWVRTDGTFMRSAQGRQQFHQDWESGKFDIEKRQLPEGQIKLVHKDNPEHYIRVGPDMLMTATQEGTTLHAEHGIGVEMGTLTENLRRIAFSVAERLGKP